MLKIIIFILDRFMCFSSLLKLFGVRPARVEAFLKSEFLELKTIPDETVWFHGASVGELEMLRPLMDDFHAKGLTFCVSAFSDSALKTLQGLQSTACYAGLSPREGLWKQVFLKFNVKKLIMSKYDLWPGMLLAAKELDLPVILINAREGRALSFIKNIFKLSMISLPRFFFFTLTPEAKVILERSFPTSAVELSLDPRFERVARRVEKIDQHSARLLTWVQQIKTLPHPCGMIGSAWLTDLEILLPALQKSKDSIVVVPHDLSEKNLQAMHAMLEEFIPNQFLLVTEMGLLVELYELADWIFVGGGFGKGVHSTLEPAIRGRPLACGPNRTTDFPEILELQKLGLLKVCRSVQEVDQWLLNTKAKFTSQSHDLFLNKRKQYQRLLEASLGIK